MENVNRVTEVKIDLGRRRARGVSRRLDQNQHELIPSAILQNWDKISPSEKLKINRQIGAAIRRSFRLRTRQIVERRQS